MPFAWKGVVSACLPDGAIASVAPIVPLGRVRELGRFDNCSLPGRMELIQRQESCILMRNRGDWEVFAQLTGGKLFSDRSERIAPLTKE